MLVSSIIIATVATIYSVLAADESLLSGMPTSVNGNGGLSGGGYGDAYAGTIKVGVYGAGGRVGGNMNLLGTLGLDRRRRQAAAIATASGTDAFSMASAGTGTGSLDFSKFPWFFKPAATTAAPAATTAAAGKR